MSQSPSTTPFVKPNDPILTQIAEAIPVDQIVSNETDANIKRLLAIAYGEQKEKNLPIMVGVAAPQFGIAKRIILVDVKADGRGEVGDLRVFINPEIIWHSEEENEWYEGCFSTDQVCGIVSRPTKITIKAYTEAGKSVEESYEGYIARIFQHEIDHLNGKEFVTHITDDANLHWVEDEAFVHYRNNEGWRTWTKKCPRKKWEKIKGNRF
jgi:peptide deformylase